MSIRNPVFALMTLVLMVMSLPLQAADFRVGAGLGYQFSGGVGVYLGRVKETTLQFASAGCSFGSHDSECGIGVGFVVTDLVAHDSNHGLGFGLSYTSLLSDMTTAGTRSSGNIYFSYQYFFKGINRRGASIGIALNVRAVGTDDSEIQPLVGLSYQF